MTSLVELDVSGGPELDEKLRALEIRGEERLRRVLDAAPDAIVVVSRDGTIRFVNAQALKMFGYSARELLGRALDTLLPERHRASHAAHLRQYFADPTVRTMGSGLELFGVRSDGTELPVEVSLSPLPLDDELWVTAAIRDIAQRKRIEAVANTLASHLASAVESIQEAFALFDVTGQLVLCNSLYRGLFAAVLPGPLLGQRYERLVERWAEELVFDDGDQRAAFCARGRPLNGSAKLELDVRTRDGRTLRVIERQTPEGGIVKTIWDLTDDARIAAELREANAAAESASAAKSEFLSSMSHELRTPLNAILGFAQLLRRDTKEPLSDRQRQKVQYILDGGDHLLRLIDDILDLSRIEAGGVSIASEPIDVLDVLAQVRTTLLPSATACGVLIDVVTAETSVPMVAADPTRFAQVLMNFGSNAVKYNRPGGKVTFSVAVPVPEFVRVTVLDTGIGIPPDKQALLFQPFQRAGQENGPIQGTGIGLAISQRLARLMGGSVGFRSTHRQGSEFWVDTPVHRSHRRSSVPPSLQSGRVDWPDEEKLVLYVEDNLANAKFMQELFAGLGKTKLLVAKTAEEGLALARAATPALIILDVNLPGMSGFDALRILRQEPGTQRVPIIALSAAASESDRRRGERAGFDRYLTKPLRVDEFAQAFRELLGMQVDS